MRRSISPFMYSKSYDGRHPPPVADTTPEIQCDGLSGAPLDQLTALEDALARGDFTTTLSQVETDARA